MRRRQFVASLPLATAATGCLGQPGQTGSTETGSPKATEPVSATLRSSYRYGVNDDAIGVTTPARAQFAFVRPPEADGERPPGDYTLEVGSEQFEPAASVQGFSPWTPGVDSVYTDERRTGALRFDVPKVEVDSAALVRDGRRWPLDERSRDRLATAPDLSLESIDAPDAVEPTERFELGVTVGNDGDRTGTFLAGFRTGGLPETVEVEVNPNDTDSGVADFEAFDDEGEMSFVYSGPGGSDSVSVPVRSQTETPPATTDGSNVTASPDPFY